MPPLCLALRLVPEGDSTNMKFLTSSFVIVLLLVSAGAEAAEKSGRLEGTIVGRDTAKNQLTIEHADVPGVMSAMTMPYEIRGQRVADLPKTGIKITATLHESDGVYWLTDVKPSAEEPMHDHTMSGAHAGMPGMQHGEHAQHGGMEGMQMATDATSELLMRQASGTSMNPAAMPMHMTMSQRGDWMLMLH